MLAQKLVDARKELAKIRAQLGDGGDGDSPNSGDEQVSQGHCFDSLSVLLPSLVMLLHHKACSCASPKSRLRHASGHVSLGAGQSSSLSVVTVGAPVAQQQVACVSALLASLHASTQAESMTSALTLKGTYDQVHQVLLEWQGKKAARLSKFEAHQARSSLAQ